MKSRLPQIQKELPVAVNRALEKSARRIAAKAAADAPVRYGDLKASLADPENVELGVFERRGEAMQGYGIFAEWYWFLVEFGHEAGGPGPKGGVTGKAAPHPFLIPAAEAERPRLVAEVKKALGDL